MKLWDKGYDLAEGIEKFTVGDDYLLDRELVYWDAAASIAHGEMLEKIGILSKKEFLELKKSLLKIIADWERGKFMICQEDEDVHTAIENRLTKELGDVGKKIHTARSRNDQVLADLRLYSKEKMLSLMESLLSLAGQLLDFAGKNREVAIPGRTHTQLAMPSSLGLFAGAYAESLIDDLLVLKAAYELNDQCPLGSAASYGVSLEIDRQMVSDSLGFAKLQNNVLYANNSRGKVEAAIIAALSQVMADLSKLSGDLIFMSLPETGYLELPADFCTGSSIMPNKKNPDILELVRAKSNKVIAAHVQVMGVIKDLPSGYNRDLQETKKPLMESISLTENSLNICKQVILGIKVNVENCKKACLPEIFATDKAVELAAGGMPWRDAYMKVAKELGEVEGEDPVKNIKKKKHVGATGNLCLSKVKKELSSEKAKLSKTKDSFESAVSKLLA